jgi:hypothetical protein
MYTVAPVESFALSSSSRAVKSVRHANSAQELSSDRQKSFEYVFGHEQSLAARLRQRARQTDDRSSFREYIFPFLIFWVSFACS